MRRTALVLSAAALALGVSAAAPPRDHALLALNVLPPGEGPNLPTLTSQEALYDGLTPLRGTVAPADLTRFFKPETLGLGGARAVRIERPRPGVTIERDAYDVPHVYGRTRADTEFGAGWATAEDRGLYLQLLRGPARIAALDVPGYDAFSLALSAQHFTPSAQTEAFLAAQVTLAERSARGRQLIRDVDAYIAGINAYFTQQGGFVAPYTRNDVVALGTLIGAVFGAGGGREAQSAELLAALQQRLGDAQGLGVWNDLREQLDPEAPVTIAQRFRYETAQSAPGPGNVALDPGSFVPTVAAPAPPQRRLMSNAILIGAKRSANGHPIFVAGPQVGYFAPEILMEEDLHGGGLDARGVAFPGLGFYLQIGRGPDYAWSATSASSDVIDEFAETLCGDMRTQYLYKGRCRDMQVFDAGSLGGKELVYRTTVHGPVVGYATSGGKPVAIALDRSTRGRELLSAIPFQVLSTAAVRSPQDFVRTMSGFDLTFNWFYADSRHIAMYSSGRLPLRAPGVNPALPTNGTGAYDWRGWLAPLAHPHVVDPPSGQIVNWNNKPASGFGAADDNWTYGSVHRVQLLTSRLTRQTLTPAQVVAAMNEAATTDLRARLVPLLAQVMTQAPAPSARDAEALQELQHWDGSRLDANGDGRIDDPAAALMDAWWPRLAVAALQPVLGPLTSELEQLNPISNDANPQGSSYGAGWYEYVDKDLRHLTGVRLHGVYSTRYCGLGDVKACATALWQALDAAVAAAPPLADATRERISFGAFLGDTMRWTNRPTFQQVVVFRSHR